MSLSGKAGQAGSNSNYAKFILKIAVNYIFINIKSHYLHIKYISVLNLLVISLDILINSIIHTPENEWPVLLGEGCGGVTLKMSLGVKNLLTDAYKSMRKDLLGESQSQPCFQLPTCFTHDIHSHFCFGLVPKSRSARRLSERVSHGGVQGRTANRVFFVVILSLSPLVIVIIWICLLYRLVWHVEVQIKLI